VLRAAGETALKLRLARPATYVRDVGTRSFDEPWKWPRMALLALAAWWTLRMGSGAQTWCFLDYVNLAFHEAGHVVFNFAGSTVHYLGGTLLQLIVPIALSVRFLLFRDEPFSAAVCVWWVGQNLIGIAIYMADARDLALPLVGGGVHDWNELFFRFDLLTEPSVQAVSGATHRIGVAVMLLGLAWASFFLLPDDTRDRVRDAASDRWPWTARALGS
jgi:hypothetical protein